ncbi:MAG TPA: 4Fe-4S binding protein [Thermoanaerobaculia bacterium]|nr:4Fe-4S binding protein [Thermoanaerobaculia bacterium]
MTGVISACRYPVYLHLQDADSPRDHRRKPLIRRRPTDWSQRWRHAFQIAFLLLNAALGAQFYLWVRQIEVRGSALHVSRPPGVEGWLPIAGLMNLKYWVLTGRIPAIHPAAMFLLVAILAIAFLFRKAFCSWLCPVGTVSEALGSIGRKILGRNLRLPKWIDVPLRGFKYLLLGFFVWAVASMSAQAIEAFMQSPYGLIADVKMLNFFRFIGGTGLCVIGLLGIASIFVADFWCRYLCPYGALLGLVSLLSPARIRRDTNACIDCGKCAKACPASLPVDRLPSVRSAECNACVACVAVCPVEGALDLSLRRPVRRRLFAPALAAAIILLFVGVVGFARTTGHWRSRVPESSYRQLVSHSEEVGHPMP